MTNQLHLALFYENEREYLDGIMRFIGPALEAGEPIAAVLPPERARVLREGLNGSAERVTILDVLDLGRNPARIIPAVERLLAAAHFLADERLGSPAPTRRGAVMDPVSVGSGTARDRQASGLIAAALILLGIQATGRSLETTAEDPG